MKRYRTILIIIGIVCLVFGVYFFSNNLSNNSKTNTISQTESNNETKQNETDEFVLINIEVNGQNFVTRFYNNEASSELMNRMPFEITMDDLHANEKYHDLVNPLNRAGNEKPSTIKQGEIMLWNTDTLVIFYETFSNSYGGYTKLGYVEDRSALKKALGSGSIKVKFAKTN